MKGYASLARAPLRETCLPSCMLSAARVPAVLSAGLQASAWARPCLHGWAMIHASLWGLESAYARIWPAQQACFAAVTQQWRMPAASVPFRWCGGLQEASFRVRVTSFACTMVVWSGPGRWGQRTAAEYIRGAGIFNRWEHNRIEPCGVPGVLSSVSWNFAPCAVGGRTRSMRAFCESHTSGSARCVNRRTYSTYKHRG